MSLVAERFLTSDFKIKMSLIVLILPCLVYLSVRDPVDSGLFPPCPFREITGYQCPGCGALRALHQMINGHILAAVSYNWLVFAALPLFSWILLSGAIPSKRTMHLANIFSSRKTIGWAILSLVIFGIIRNTDIYPFKLVAPWPSFRCTVAINSYSISPQNEYYPAEAWTHVEL